jgi:histone H3/H4
MLGISEILSRKKKSGPCITLSTVNNPQNCYTGQVITDSTRVSVVMANPLFPTDTIRDVAESLGIVTLSADAAKQLAMDVEYRIQEVVQEALKFMRHSKRTVLSPADISSALKTLNIEVLVCTSVLM